MSQREHNHVFLQNYVGNIIMSLLVSQNMLFEERFMLTWTPLHFVYSTRRLCDQQAQTTALMESKEYEKLISSLMTHGHLQMECIKEVVVVYFRWVMLLHT